MKFLLAASVLACVPAAFAGCYSKGPTWSDFNKEIGSPSLYEIAKIICRDVSQSSYLPLQAKNGCLSGSNNAHVSYEVSESQGYRDATINFDACVSFVQVEMHGCEHGSDQVFDNRFNFYLDPNQGKDW